MADEVLKPELVKDNGEAPRAPAPICPGCKADPLFVLATMFNCGPFKFLLVFCAKCNQVVPATLLEIAQPKIATPTRSSLII
jgi:hypothetical protein